MNKLRLTLLLGLCIFIALLSIGYITVGMKEKQPEEASQTTTAASTASETTTAQADSTAGETAAEQSTAEETTTTQPVTMGNEYEYAYAGFNPAVATVDSEKWNLLLVNQDYILPEDFTVQTAAISGSSQSMDYRVVPHYNDMVAAAKADGISLIPISGYRTIERQRTNFERKIDYYTTLGYSDAQAAQLASKIVLLPGTSEHNAGLAMDFGTDGNTSLTESFADTDAFKWLSENAADYGFILRYAEDTQDITKVIYEPWHWRYVGVEAAKEIVAQGVTLEEYLGMA